MKLTGNAVAVLRERYLTRDRAGEVVETPEQLFERVADSVAEAERRFGAGADQVASTARRFAERMAELEFLPNSPTLMNAGREVGQLAACFVVPVGNSDDEIRRAIAWAERIQRTGGGTGFSFSSVGGRGGSGRGVVDVIRDFDRATEGVRQVGVRRGANMGVLRVDHPEILAFVTAKVRGEELRNFNLSVAASDEFMAAVDAGDSYPLVSPGDGAVCGRLDAREVFDAIADAAWNGGDPGLLFIDRIEAAQPTPALGRIEATNPCGEQPLLPFESCNLGSINVARFVGGGDIDWPRLEVAVHDAVRFLDDVIEINRFPLPEIEAATRATRKIGLGIMGWADCLIELGIPYADERALELADRVAAFVERESVLASAQLAGERGPFPAYPRSRWAKGAMGTSPGPLRNAATTTVAPTGTIAIIAGCSSGIEPLYAIAYQRRALDGRVLREVHRGFVDRARRRGLWNDALERVLNDRGSVGELTDLPSDFRQLFATAHELSIDEHLRMQARFQRHVHASVSKTVNLPASAERADVARAFRLAYELGCKGVTIYRDGSKSEQVLASGASEAVTADNCPGCGTVPGDAVSCRVCPQCGMVHCG